MIKTAMEDGGQNNNTLQYTMGDHTMLQEADFEGNPMMVQMMQASIIDKKQQPSKYQKMHHTADLTKLPTLIQEDTAPEHRVILKPKVLDIKDLIDYTKSQKLDIPF